MEHSTRPVHRHSVADSPSVKEEEWIVLVGSSGGDFERSDNLQFCIPENVAERTQEIQSCIFWGYPRYLPFSKKLKILYEETLFGVCWDLCVVGLSLVVYGLFVYIVGKNGMRNLHYDLWMDVFEFVAVGFFAMDLFLRWIIYGSHSEFYFSFDSLFETWMDVFMLSGFLASLYHSRADLNLGFSRAARTLRLLRPSGFIDLCFPYRDVFARKLFYSFVSVFVALIITSGMVQLADAELFVHPQYTNCVYLEETTDWEPSCFKDRPTFANDTSCDCSDHNCVAVRRYLTDLFPYEIRCKTMTLYEAFWFMVVTATTVGYGDFTPKTTFGKLAVMLFIIWFLFFINKFVQEVNSLLQGNTRYLTYHAPPLTGTRNILIVGSVNDKTILIRTLTELCTLERNVGALQVIIMAPCTPPKSTIDVLHMQGFHRKARYIIGSPISEADLMRVSAHKADAALILSDAQSMDVSKEDVRSVLMTIAIENLNPRIRTYSQVLLKSNKSLVKKDADFVLCFEEMRASMLAVNALVPGAACLLTNLFTTVESSGSQISKKPWLKEYLDGIEYELYLIQISTVEVWETLRQDFAPFVIWLFIRYSVIMIGVASSRHQHKIILNPSELPPQSTSTSYFDSLILLCPHEAQANAIQAHLNGSNKKLLIKTLGALSPKNGKPVKAKCHRSVRSSSGSSLRSIKQEVEIYDGDTEDFARWREKNTIWNQENERMSVRMGPDGSFDALARKAKNEKLKQLVVEGKLSGYIALVGEFQSAKHLLGHLRNDVHRATRLCKPVVVVTKEYSEEEERYANNFENVVVLEAEPRMHQSLFSRADSCLILQSSVPDPEYADFELGPDAKSVINFLRMHEALTSSFFCVELINEDSVGVLNSTIIRREKAAHALVNIEDSPVVNGNPRPLRKGLSTKASKSNMKRALLDELDGWNEAENRKERQSTRAAFSAKAEERHHDPDEQGFHKKALYASGACYLPFLKDKLLVQAFFSSHIPVVFEHLLRGLSPNALLFQCAIPEEYFKHNEFEGTSYTWIFSCFLKKRKCLAIALYRAKTLDNQAGLSYVYTCPDPMAKVTKRDRIFLLGSKENLIDLVGKEKVVL